MAGPDGDFDTLFSVEYPRVLRTLVLICRDPHLAQDVAQDAFVELLRHWDRVSRHDRPGAWVRRVAIRKLMRVRQRDARRRQAEVAVEPPPPLEPADLDVMRALHQVPTRQRAALVLYYFEDLAVHDVAEALGCSAATAGVHLHRGRAKLESLLREVAPDGR